MRRIDRFRVGAGLFFALTLLPLSGIAEDEPPKLHDCGERTCGEWQPKGENTCRTCTTMQCKDVQDGEAIAGSKKETECYEGHGPPPED